MDTHQLQKAEKETVAEIVKQFIAGAEVLSIELLTGGLIHRTCKTRVRSKGVVKDLVLQRLNTRIFCKPHALMENSHIVGLLIDNDYPLTLIKALETTDGHKLYTDSKGECWRVFPFVENSICVEAPPDIEYAYKAGRAYGMFLTAVRPVDPELLYIPIPEFHSPVSRFKLFFDKLAIADPQRKNTAAAAIERVCHYYRELSFDFSALPVRVVHNDCKFGNLLFDKTSKECVAVIDLDTLMPGCVVTDFGDMVRSMCSTATEQDNESLVSFNIDYFDAVKAGFLSETGDWLTAAEQAALVDGACYIVLEQAVRFLTDYLDHDSYYGARYPQQNHDRARNQLALLESMLRVVQPSNAKN